MKQVDDRTSRAILVDYVNIVALPLDAMNKGLWLVGSTVQLEVLY